MKELVVLRTVMDYTEYVRSNHFNVHFEVGGKPTFNEKAGIFDWNDENIATSIAVGSLSNTRIIIIG